MTYITDNTILATKSACPDSFKTHYVCDITQSYNPSECLSISKEKAQSDSLNAKKQQGAVIVGYLIGYDPTTTHVKMQKRLTIAVARIVCGVIPEISFRSSFSYN